MLNYFQISFPDAEVETYNLYHIQYNFLNCLKNYKFIKYKRINILIQLSSTEVIDFVGLDSSILNIHIEANIINPIDLTDDFFKWVYDKTNYALGILWDFKKWPLENLKKLHSYLRENNYQCLINFSKRKKSILKDFSAELNIELLPTFANLYADFYDKKNTHINHVLLIKGFVDISLYTRFFSNSYWTIENKYIIQDELKEIEFIVSPLNPEINVHYSPMYNTEKQLKKLIKALSWNISQEERLKLLML